MRALRIILAVVLLAAAPLGTLAAQGNAHPGSAPAGAQHGIPLYAVEIARVPLGPLGALPITNSMLVTWIVALGLIVFAQVATRRIKAVPEGAQNFWEWLVESLYGFLENIIGHELVRKTFWFFATIFIFILFSNWFGLIPFVGTVGWGHYDPNGHFILTRPWLRGANADLNMTFAMALTFFACWLVWALQAHGVGGVLFHIFGAKGQTTGLLRLLMIVIFFAVGILEVVSILFRPVSLSFRLFGNIYAGENMLEAMSNLVQHPAWLKFLAGALIPVPFYFLELLVGLAQALVFMLLTAVFTLLIMQEEEDHRTARHE